VCVWQYVGCLHILEQVHEVYDVRVKGSATKAVTSVTIG